MGENRESRDGAPGTEQGFLPGPAPAGERADSDNRRVLATESPSAAAPGFDGQRQASRGPGGGGARWLTSGEKPRNTRGTLARLWRIVRESTRALTFVLAMVLISSAAVLTAPYLIGRAIDTMAGGSGAVRFPLLAVVTITLGIAYLLNAGTTLVQGWVISGISQRIVAAIRRTLFGKLQKLPIGFFDTHEHGDLMSRVANDIDNISLSLSQLTGQMMGNVVAIAGSLVMMIILSPLLTAASLVTIPLVFLLTKTISGRTRKLFKAQQVSLGALNGHVEETISGLSVVKAFEREGQVIGHFDTLNTELRENGRRALIWSGYLMPLMNVISNLGFVAVAAVGGVLAVRGAITIGVIASFLSYSRQFTRPLNDIANVYNTMQTALAGAERVFEIVDEPEESEDPEQAIELVRPSGHVAFENVSFEYVAGRPVLRNVSIDAPPGSSTALVGPTGAGKTTIVNLLARFYDVTQGRILIDGRDIRDCTRDSLRKCFGIVLQDTYLFAGTIRDNIAYGNPQAGPDAIAAAAEAANADHFIRRFHAGYDTVLAESGSNLSQGQRQLLAIARAILSDPAILILDEATSNVDTRTELHIQEAMLKLMQGRTSFIIAHRLSTIRDADRILVVDNGSIVAEGTHAELLAADGVYRKMYESQTLGIPV